MTFKFAIIRDVSIVDFQLHLPNTLSNAKMVKLGQMTHLMTSMKKFKYKVVRDHQDLHLIYSQFFHLAKFELILSTFVQNPRQVFVKLGQMTNKIT